MIKRGLERPFEQNVSRSVVGEISRLFSYGTEEISGDRSIKRFHATLSLIAGGGKEVGPFNFEGGRLSVISAGISLV